MRYEMNFGQLRSGLAPRNASTQRLRIAVLGDFSAHANQGQLVTGQDLLQRKPQRVDVDNFDEVISRFGIQVHLPVSDYGGAVTVAIESMEDFHPDQLYGKLEIFSKLSGLRQKLMDRQTFAGASKAVQSLLGQAAMERHEHRVQKPKSSVIPNAKLDDFSRLMGTPTTSEPDTPVTDLIKRIIRSHIVPDADPRQDQMVGAVDEALSETMRRVLHHPDFQSLESLWRSIELLVRRLDASGIDIVLFDLSAEEFAADLSAAEQLEDTGIYQWLIEQPRLDADQGAFSLVLANYTFDQTPPHADLLGRMSRICAAAHAPFFAAMSSDCLKRQAPDAIPPVVKQAWNALCGLPEAGYLGMTVPRFMLRWPYSKKTDPIESFEFEEFTRTSGVRGMLWGNAAFLAGLLIGETFQQQGLKGMKLGSVLTVGDMPYYYYTDEEGDQIALPCTDRLLSQRMAEFVNSLHIIPVLSMKGRAEVRLGGFKSLQGESIRGPWGEPLSQLSSAKATVGEATPSAPAPAAEPVKSAAEDTAPPSPASGDMDELDALLAGLDTPAASEPTSESSPPAEAGGGMDELDALLAGLESPPAEPAQGESQMDPDLAALLADL